MAGVELRCASCTYRKADGTIAHVPFEFVPRVLVQRESGRQSFVPVIRCPNCEGVEEWPGYDFMAVTSEAVHILAACRFVLAQQGGPAEVIEKLSRMVDRFNAQINHEFARVMRVRLGI